MKRSRPILPDTLSVECDLLEVGRRVEKHVLFENCVPIWMRYDAIRARAVHGENEARLARIRRRAA